MKIRNVVAHKAFRISVIIFGVLLLSIYPAYLISKVYFNWYFKRWGDRLVSFEKRGLLSNEFGVAWQDILEGERMNKKAEEFTEADTSVQTRVVEVDGVAVKDYPSLQIVARLNEINKYSNTITITDRNNLTIATIRTDHTRGRIGEFPEVLKKALIAAEDSRFYKNQLGFEFDSFVRAVLRALWQSVTHFSISSPKGTSTITQQVAKLFVSYRDESGQRQVSRSVDRKLRELRLSAALRKMYTGDQIFEVYLNHCIASDYGLIGVKDIARGLFRKELSELSDAECIYIARMVKWGRNIHHKIARQCLVDMPRMKAALGWDQRYCDSILAVIDSLHFTKPKQIQTDYGHLVDLANEFWLQYLNKSGAHTAEYLQNMDLIDPNSLIRKKGNLSIRLTIDLPLQKFLEKLVNNRGFGPDTIIYTDVRIGSRGEDVQRNSAPVDTLRAISVVDTITSFTEAGSEFLTTLDTGDTLITNVRYKRVKDGMWRRSIYYYTRRFVKVDGQYYSYCILDAQNGTLLAYYSRDKIGSRLVGLLKYRIPNGSSTAKPIFNALNFDLGIFPAYATWNDSIEVNEDVAWKRTIIRKDEKPYEVVFAQSAVPGTGYQIHNHEYVFGGCQYVFDHLTASNNILGVETVYRLNQTLFDPTGRVREQAFPFAQFLYRLNALERIKKQFKTKTVTGVRLYKELAGIVGVDIDSMVAYGKKIAVSDSLYSVALGTLEMTIYEQAHLFNMLYNNDLVEHPARHPSLVIDSITMNSVGLSVREFDTVKRYHPFVDINNLRPTYLGLHNRLIENRWDGLSDYDIAYPVDSTLLSDSVYNPEAIPISGPLANFAKSGTTDDVLRPFDADVTSSRRTNFGLWNAVIRIDLAKLRNDPVTEVRDITIACIGECNTQYTGVRDGKTLHKYVSKELLAIAGIKAPNGFFTFYEKYLKAVTPDSVRCAQGAMQDEKAAAGVRSELGD